jgi:uncharacterized protein (TIGR02266 family)
MSDSKHEISLIPGVRPQRYILVIAGDPDDLYRTSLLLQRFAYPVCTAQSGKQAFEMVSVSMPSLLITDLVLPDGSGLDLLRKLGCDARTLPVIILLPEAEAHVEARHIEIGGGVPCIAKPVQADDLFRLVQTAIEPTPRMSIRIPTRLAVTINRVLLDVHKGEYITDISGDGIYVRTLKPLRRGDRVSVQFHIAGREITADATVLYVHRPSEGLFREPGMALRFEQLSAGDQEIIRNHIRDTITQGIGGRQEISETPGS